MLVQMRIKNLLSIRDEQVLSLAAQSGLREKSLDEKRNTFSIDEDTDLLKSAVIYGANASGKSNVINAILAYWQLFNHSINATQGMALPVNSFALRTDTMNAPTLLEAVFFWNGLYYRYGYEVTTQEVISEWLFVTKKKETPVFQRNRDSNEIPEKHKILRLVKDQKIAASNVLFLPKATLLNDPIANDVHGWLSQLDIISGVNDFLYSGYTLGQCQDEIRKKAILELLQIADFGIKDFEVRQLEQDAFSFNVALKKPAPEAKFTQSKANVPIAISKREVFDESGKATGLMEFPLELRESEGTKKFFHMSAPILNVLEQGRILVVDELDTKLHPLLTQRIVELFHSPKTNQKNAQLIFATHDTNLLNANIFRRDQIWFTEKKKDGSTELYSLGDFKKFKARNDTAIEKNYLEGRFGGIPYLNQLDAVIESE